MVITYDKDTLIPPSSPISISLNNLGDTVVDAGTRLDTVESEVGAVRASLTVTLTEDVFIGAIVSIRNNSTAVLANRTNINNLESKLGIVLDSNTDLSAGASISVGIGTVRLVNPFTDVSLSTGLPANGSRVYLALNGQITLEDAAPGTNDRYSQLIGYLTESTFYFEPGLGYELRTSALSETESRRFLFLDDNSRIQIAPSSIDLDTDSDRANTFISADSNGLLPLNYLNNVTSTVRSSADNLISTYENFFAQLDSNSKFDNSFLYSTVGRTIGTNSTPSYLIRNDANGYLDPSITRHVSRQTDFSQYTGDSTDSTDGTTDYFLTLRENQVLTADLINTASSPDVTPSNDASKLLELNSSGIIDSGFFQIDTGMLADDLNVARNASEVATLAVADDVPIFVRIFNNDLIAANIIETQTVADAVPGNNVNRIFVPNSSGVLDMNILPTADSFVQNAVTLIRTTSNGRLDRNFIQTIAGHGDPTMPELDANAIVALNEDGVINSSLIESAATFDAGESDRIVRTNGTRIDTSLITTTLNVSSPGTIVATNASTGRINHVYLPTESTRMVDSSGLIPISLDDGYLSTTWYRNASTVAEVTALSAESTDRFFVSLPGDLSALIPNAFLNVIPTTPSSDITDDSGLVVVLDSAGRVPEEYIDFPVVSIPTSTTGMAERIPISPAGQNYLNNNWLNFVQSSSSDKGDDVNKFAVLNSDGEFNLSLLPESDTGGSGAANRLIRSSGVGLLPVSFFPYNLTTRSSEADDSSLAAYLIQLNAQGKINHGALISSTSPAMNVVVRTTASSTTLARGWIPSIQAPTSEDDGNSLVGLNSSEVFDFAFIPNTASTYVADTADQIIITGSDGLTDIDFLAHGATSTEFSADKYDDLADTDRILLSIDKARNNRLTSDVISIITESSDDPTDDESRIVGLPATGQIPFSMLDINNANVEGLLTINTTPTVDSIVATAAGSTTIARGWIPSIQAPTSEDDSNLLIALNSDENIDYAFVPNTASTYVADTADQIIVTGSDGLTNVDFLPHGNVAANFSASRFDDIGDNDRMFISINKNLSNKLTADVISIITSPSMDQSDDENKIVGLPASGRIPAAMLDILAITSTPTQNSIVATAATSSTINRGWIPSIQSPTANDDSNSLIGLNSSEEIDRAFIPSIQSPTANNDSNSLIGLNSNEEFDFAFIPNTSNSFTADDENAIPITTSDGLINIDFLPHGNISANFSATRLDDLGDSDRVLISINKDLSNKLTSDVISIITESSDDPSEDQGRIVGLGSTGQIPMSMLDIDTSGIEGLLTINTTPTADSIVATAVGSTTIARGWIPSIQSPTSEDDENSLIALNSDEEIDRSFIPSIQSPTANNDSNRLVGLNSSEEFDFAFIPNTASTYVADTADQIIITGSDGLVHVDFLPHGATSTEFSATKYDDLGDTSRILLSIDKARTNKLTADVIEIITESSDDPTEDENAIVGLGSTGQIPFSMLNITTANVEGLLTINTTPTQDSIVATASNSTTIARGWIPTINAPSASDDSNSILALNSSEEIDYAFIPNTSATFVADTENQIIVTGSDGLTSIDFLPHGNIAANFSASRLDDLADTDRVLISINKDLSNKLTSDLIEIITESSDDPTDDQGSIVGLGSTGQIPFSMLDLSGSNIEGLLNIATTATANSIVATPVGSTTIDRAWIPTINAPTDSDDTNALISLNSDEEIDFDFIPNTTSARSGNNEDMIPLTGANGYLSTTFFRTASSATERNAEQGADDQLIFLAVEKSDGTLSSDLINGIDEPNDTPANDAGFIFKANSSGLLDNGFFTITRDHIDDAINIATTATADSLVATASGTTTINDNFINTVNTGGVANANRIPRLTSDGEINYNMIDHVTAGGSGSESRLAILDTNGQWPLSMIPLNFTQRLESGQQVGLENYILRLNSDGFVNITAVPNSITPESNVLVQSDNAEKIDSGWLRNTTDDGIDPGNYVRLNSEGVIPGNHLPDNIVTGSLTQIMIANEDITASDTANTFVELVFNSGESRYEVRRASYTSESDVLGYIEEDVDAGNNITVFLTGIATTNITLVPGRPCFVSNTSITQDNTAISDVADAGTDTYLKQLGAALTSTQLLFTKTAPTVYR